MRIAPLFALLLVAACAPVPAPMSPPSAAAYTPWPAATADEAATDAACAARGGLGLARIGKAQTLTCIIRYADAAKACTDGAQCLGQRCMGDAKDEAATAPVAGHCVATNDPFGCQTIIRAGKAATICVD